MLSRLNTVFLFLFFCFSHSAFSQIQVVAEQDQDRNLTLISFNKSPIPYTIRIEFQKLENLESMEGRIIFATANPGKSILTKLRSIYVNEKTGFQYNTQLFKGDFKLFTPNLPPYLIPIEKGKKLQMRPLTVQTSAQNATIYTGVGFFVEEKSTVCAPRKGIVSAIQMDKPIASTGPSNWESENYVEIYHADGTFSRVSGLAPNSALVEVGDTVFPGQAIASSSATSDQNVHLVKMIQSRWEMGDFKMEWVNFTVKIQTDSQLISTEQILENVESNHPQEIILLEMDKKELKKYTGK